MLFVVCFLLAVGFASVLGGTLWACERAVSKAAERRTFDSVERVPYRPVGIVLGCSKHVAGGRLNLYFRYRIAAAAELYKAGKVDYLIVSGDNHRVGYDEPTDMKESLVEMGIPAERVQCDYAGFRTLDSVVRAGKVFCSDRITVISQRFHGERAVYIGNCHGLDVIAYNARDVRGRSGLRSACRERLARVKAVLDVNVLHKQPRFLGDQIPVGTAGQ